MIQNTSHCKAHVQAVCSIAALAAALQSSNLDFLALSLVASMQQVIPVRSWLAYATRQQTFGRSS